MNTILTQECFRYNQLLRTMTEDLKNFKDANRGLVIMNDDLERMGVTMLNNEIPARWTEENGCGFLSIKPLSTWIQDLRDRVDFFREWAW